MKPEQRSGFTHIYGTAARDTDRAHPDRRKDPAPMCRAQPGPRCPKHAQAKVTSLLASRARIIERRDNAKPGGRTWEKAVQALDVNDDDLVIAITELNASPARWDKLEAEIGDLVNGDPNDPRIRDVARNLATGKLLHAERARQSKMMPAIDRGSAHPAAKAAHTELGESRADMARYKIRMDMNGSNPDAWAKWRDRHADAARDAELAAARFRTIQTHGPDAWPAMTADERSAVRATIRQTADFTTPTAPQPLADVFNDHVDRESGEGPLVDERLVNYLGESSPPADVDSTSWAEQRALKNAATSNEADSDGDADEDEDGPRYSSRQRTPPGYAGRRASRRRRMVSGKQMWRQIQKGERGLDGSGLKQWAQPAPGQGRDPDLEAVTDPTGMTLLFNLVTNRR